jgi:TetR/AcrR family transcriptional regulator, cholesterol catabolism regulator
MSQALTGTDAQLAADPAPAAAGPPAAAADAVAVAEDQLRHRRRRSNKTQFVNRRNEIIDLAASLFAKKGYAATGIREIGEQADLARGALYYYIESKESLLSEIHNRVLDPLLESTESILALECSTKEKIQQISEVLLRQVIERHDHVWVFLHEYRSLTGERRETFRRKRAAFEKALMMLFSAGIADGEFLITDLRLTMMAFLGMHNYTYQWIGRSAPVDTVALSRLYCGIFFKGIEVRGPVPEQI